MESEVRPIARDAYERSRHDLRDQQLKPYDWTSLALWTGRSGIRS
jgi:hypothetical protein